MRANGRYRTEGTKLPLDKIITRPQMRVTIDPTTIAELKENIAEHGLIYPLLIAETDEGPVLFAGHRRFRACRELRTEGRFAADVNVILFRGLSPITMALLQASENIHEAIPPHEAAHFYDITWRMLREQDPEFPLTRFAKSIGRSEETVRVALRFALLPEAIQRLVKDRVLPYGAAVELSRLSGIVAEEEITRRALLAAAGNHRVSQVRKQVASFLRERDLGQQSLFAIFTEESRRLTAREAMGLLLDRESSRAFIQAHQYFARLFALLESGRVGFSESPLRKRQTLAAFRRTVAVLQRLVPHLRDLLGASTAQRIQLTLDEAEGLSRILEHRIPKSIPP